MFVVDASVWVARYVPTDAHHDPSFRWLQGLVDDMVPIYAPMLLLPELAGPVSRRMADPAEAVDAVEVLLELPTLHLEPLDADLAHDSWLLAAERGLRGADAVYLALAEFLGFPLVTWDREQLERAPDVISVSTPAELLERGA